MCKGKAIALSLFLFLALLPSSPAQEKPSPTLYPVLVNGKWGFINRQGQIVIKPQFGEVSQGFNGVGWFVGNNHNERKCVKDTAQVLSMENCFGSSCSEGLCTFLDSRFEKSGYEGLDRKVIIAPRFDMALKFSEGMAAVQEGKQWEFINHQGKVVIGPQFTHAKNFHEGLAAVCVNYKWGYIDQTGNFVMKAQFNLAGNFTEGLAPVCSYDHDFWKPFNCKYIDHKGRTIIEGNFDRADEFNEGIAKVLVQRNSILLMLKTLYKKWLSMVTGEKFKYLPGDDPWDYKVGYIKRDGTYFWPLQH